MKVHTIAAIVPAVLLLAACSGGSGAAKTPADGGLSTLDADGRWYAQTFADWLQPGDAGDIGTDRRAAECVGARIVTVMGVDHLQAIGSPVDLTLATTGNPPTRLHVLDPTTAQATAIYDSFAPCGVDLLTLVRRNYEADHPEFLDSLDPESLDPDPLETESTAPSSQPTAPCPGATQKKEALHTVAVLSMTSTEDQTKRDPGYRAALETLTTCLIVTVVTQTHD